MSVRKFRFLTAALLLALTVLLIAAAGAETSEDITSSCHFKALSGRKSFRNCTDRDYKTYWRSDNGKGGINLGKEGKAIYQSRVVLDFL